MNKILIVEDEAIVARDIGYQLQQLNYEPVASTETGEESLLLADRLRPDLVLMDIQLAGAMDGIIAAQTIRERFNIPVVFLTAFAGDGSLERAKLTEPFGYILKPFEQRDLQIVLSMALYKHKADKEMRAVNQQLRANEERFNQLAKQSRTGIWEVDADGLYTNCSQVFSDLAGYPIEEIVGKKHFYDFHPEKGRDVFKTAALEVFARKDFFHDLENPIQTKDGRTIWVSTNGIPVLDNDGRLLGYQGSGTDITQRKRAEEALKTSEERFRLAMDATTDGLWDWNIATGVVDYSPAWKGMLSLEAVEPNYEIWESRIHPDDRQKVIEGLHAHLAGKTAQWSKEHRLLTAQGTWKWVLGRGRVVVRDAQGCPCRMIGTMTDISERKQATESMRESEERFHVLASLLPAGIYLTTPQGQCQYANPHWCEMAGMSLEESLGGGWVKGLHPEDQTSVFSAWQQMVNSEGRWGLEYRFQTPDGKVTWVYGLAVPQRDSLKKIVGYVGVNIDITERKRAEEESRKSHEQIANILESISDAFFSLDDEMRVTYFNKASESLLGRCGGDVIGRNLFDAFPEARGSIFEERYRQAIREKCALNFETCFDVEPYRNWYEVRIFPQEKGISVFFQVTTERKRAEEALRRNEAKHGKMIANIGDVIVVIDQNGITRYKSPNITKYFGWRPEEVVGVSALEIVHPDDLNSAQRFIGSLMDTHNATATTECRYRCKDGSYKWIEFTGVNLVHDPDIAGILGNYHDITERKRAEAQIKKLSSAVEQSTVSIVITDLTGAIEYVNPKFTQVTAYTLEEVRGQNSRVLKGDKISADEYRRLWECITHGQEWHGEFHNRKKNGDFYWESAVISPVVDAEGHTTHYLAVKEDITDRKVLEEQFRQSQKLESIGQLAGGVAHDFNNILAAMMMRLSFMQKNTSADQEALAELTADAKRAASLTRQLLLFSRRSVMEVELLDLNELVANALKMLSRLIGDHITMQFKRRDGLPGVEADAVMLEQVLMNLAVNARDAMPKGGLLAIMIEPVQIDEEQVKSNIDARPGQFVCLSVADTGSGMDEVILKRIFEPFFTTKPVGKGTGLGLATVHGIVAQHKGWVEVESELGKGTTFKVFLPATQKKMTEPTQIRQMDIVRGDETILLVEDESNLRRLVVQGLRQLGYRVFEADNGQTAMKIWQEHGQQIDLLFSDMVMPEGMTGLDLAEKMKAEKPILKVIISSGYNMEMAGQVSPTAGGIVYFQKPYDVEVLSKTIRDCLDRA